MIEEVLLFSRLKIVLFLLLLVAMSAGCTKKQAQVEISIDDFSYDDSSERLTVTTTARNTGDIGVKNVRCTIQVVSTFTPYSTPVATKDVSFGGGGTISEGQSRTETIVMNNVSLLSILHYVIKAVNIQADPESQGFLSCSKPIS